MGARGPKPVPDNVHRLNNNPSKKRLNFDPNTAVPVEIPECPDFLSEAAKQEWDRITVDLFRFGLVSKIDRAALAVYCQAYARLAQIETELNNKGLEGLTQKTPNGYEVPSALIILAKQQIEIMKSFLAEFGMTPSARVRVNPSPQMDLFPDGKENGDSKGKQAGAKSGYFS